MEAINKEPERLDTELKHWRTVNSMGTTYFALNQIIANLEAQNRLLRKKNKLNLVPSRK